LQTPRIIGSSLEALALSDCRGILEMFSSYPGAFDKYTFTGQRERGSVGAALIGSLSVE